MEGSVFSLITLEVAIAIVGVSFAVVFGAVGLIVNHLRNKQDWKEPLNEVENKVLEMEGNYKSLNEQMKDLKENLDKHDQRDAEDFKRIEGQVGRLTDLIIKSLTQDGDK